LAFDILNFSPQDSTQTQMRLESVVAIQGEFSDLPVASTIADWGPSELNSRFEAQTVDMLDNALMFGNETSGLTILPLLEIDLPDPIIPPLKNQSKGLDYSSITFGSWSYLSDIDLLPDTLYEVIWTVSSSAPKFGEDDLATIRLRVNRSSLETYHIYTLESFGESPNMPTSVNSVTYRQWIQTPTDAPTDQAIFSFDYMHQPDFGNDPTLSVTLENLTVKQYGNSL